MKFLERTSARHALIKWTEDETMTIRIRIESDGDIQNPADFDCNWHPYSFSTRHTNYRDPESLGLSLDRRNADGTPKIVNPGLRRKLEVGLAFFLSYYEHGGSLWSLRSDPSRPRCQFDSVSLAGLLVWEDEPKDIGAKTYEERAKDATRFLEIYNHWSNGEGLGYAVETAEECDHGENHYEEIDSCWGFYANDVDHVLDNIYDAIPEDRRGEPLEWAGDLGKHLSHKWDAAVARGLERRVKAESK